MGTRRRALTACTPRTPTSSRAAPRKVIACGLGLGLVTLLMCAVRIRNGGFYYDDWVKDTAADARA